MRVTTHPSQFGREYWTHLSEGPAVDATYRVGACGWYHRVGIGEQWEIISADQVPLEVLQAHAYDGPLKRGTNV